MQSRREPARRIPSSSVCDVFDEIIRRRRLEHPYSLYRFIARACGIHATTVMRYHQGCLATADATVHSRALALLEEARRGHRLPFERQAGAKTSDDPTRSPRRVPSARVREILDEIRRALRPRQRQFLYRYVADRLDMHPTTVLRYHTGDLQTAPAKAFAEMNELRARIARGEPVPFTRNEEGTSVVLRERTVELLQRLLRHRGDRGEAEVLRRVEVRLDLDRGVLSRIHENRDLAFVASEVHRALEMYVDGSAYDASRVYEQGDHIWHPLFGVGSVADKIHKNKILVEFVDGQRVVLSEAVPGDPNAYARRRRTSKAGVADSWPPMG